MEHEVQNTSRGEERELQKYLEECKRDGVVITKEMELVFCKAYEATLQRQVLAARRCRHALYTLTKEYPTVFGAANREDEGWDGDPETMGRLSLDEMYDTVVFLEDKMEEEEAPDESPKVDHGVN